MESVEFLREKFHTAICPEEIFGIDGNVDREFRRLAKMVHPDRFRGDTAAVDAFQRLEFLKQEAEKRIKAGDWGKNIPLAEFATVTFGSYEVRQKKSVRGDVADIYRVAKQDLIVKVAMSSDDNDLIRAEAEALSTVGKKIKTVVSEGVPQLVDAFSIGKGFGSIRANVLTHFNGFMTAEQVKVKLPKIDPRSAVWMFKRLLVLLEWTHHAGIVHGAVLPPHVMFYPDNDGRTVSDPRKHSIRLIDWCYSVRFKERTRLSAWVPAWKDLYAPEILSKGQITPAADLYMAAGLTRYLCEDALPVPLMSVLDGCLQKSVSVRFSDAGVVFGKWISAATEAYGKPKWIDFNVPK